MAFRTFIGSCATLISSVTNLSVLTILDGEPGWICLMLCNLDSMSTQQTISHFFLLTTTTNAVLFSVLVLHWATSVDREEGSIASSTPQGDAIFGSRGENTASRAKSDFATNPRKAGVTTNIEANKGGHSEDIALDTVFVKTHQIQEVELRSQRTSRSNDLEYAQERHGSEDSIVRVDNRV